MTTSIHLDDDFVKRAQVHAKIHKRPVPKQIEHWAEIGRVAEDNPDLPYEFIKNALIGIAEVKAGKATPYVRGKT